MFHKPPEPLGDPDEDLIGECPGCLAEVKCKRGKARMDQWMQGIKAPCCACPQCGTKVFLRRKPPVQEQHFNDY
jgi:hypothetical protein